MVLLGLMALLEFRRGRPDPNGSTSPSLFVRLYTIISTRVDWTFGWDHLPLPIAIVVLLGQRVLLRDRNLFDTRTLPAARPEPPAGYANRYLTSRTPDGTYNDLSDPAMGSAGTRFGRNVPLDRTYPQPLRDLLEPSPRLVSRQLLTRDTFQPATTLNLLAGAWLQFMVHDWLSHGSNETEQPFEIELEPDDPWPDKPMKILRTRQDPTRTPADNGSPPTYANTATHWWDASQLYGSDVETLGKLRWGVDGKLRIENGLLPVDPKTGTDLTGVNGNFWLGLSAFHTLFALEHNAICDRLKSEYPGWRDDDLFEHARLVNAALLAKIHTIEWTPAIIAHPTTQYALRGNWFGAQGEQLHRYFGRLSSDEVISGIPGSPTDLHGVPYSITEEFVAVYRMHPLIPDDYQFRSCTDDSTVAQLTFRDISFADSRIAMERIGLRDTFYSMGTMHPGAITLHNYPRFLQRLEEPDTPANDLAAIDILRTRERGVPRYNAFRELLHKPRVSTFEQLTDNSVWADELRRIYGDVDKVDLMVGLYAEPKPVGFGFSDTAFRIFILMASRRLESDRFFTKDYTPEVYTSCGMKWIDDNGFASVLRRHLPELAPALDGVRNPFAPWRRSGSPR